MFCAGRVENEDLKRTMHACGGSIQTTVTSLTDDVLGTCQLFEEKQVGGERFVLFATNCKKFTSGGTRENKKVYKVYKKKHTNLDLRP
jgi:T-complex protein 1 subunit eta